MAADELQRVTEMVKACMCEAGFHAESELILEVYINVETEETHVAWNEFPTSGVMEACDKACDLVESRYFKEHT